MGGNHGGSFVALDAVEYTKFKTGKVSDKKTWKDGSERLMIRQGRDASGTLVNWPKNAGTTNKPSDGFYMELESGGTTVENIWEVLTIGSDQYIRMANYDDQAAQMSALVGGFNARDRAARDSRAPGTPDRDAADRRRGVRTNPTMHGMPPRLGITALVHLQLWVVESTSMFKFCQRHKWHSVVSIKVALSKHNTGTTAQHLCQIQQV